MHKLFYLPQLKNYDLIHVIFVIVIRVVIGFLRHFVISSFHYVKRLVHSSVLLLFSEYSII